MITPSDTPSSPAGYAEVTPHGQGIAPYDVQAPQADLAGLVAEAGALAGAGVIYPQGPRQAMTEAHRRLVPVHAWGFDCMECAVITGHRMHSEALVRAAAEAAGDHGLAVVTS